MTLVLREEQPGDFAAIFDVHLQAFGQDAEARLVDRLRAAGHGRLSLVALLDGKIVGHIFYSELPIIGSSDRTPAVALAPMAVLPHLQSQGIGSALVRESLELLRQNGEMIVIVLGHEHYYPRFGFSAQLAQPLKSPYSGPAFMALELVAGALSEVRGRVDYPPPFSEM